MPTLPGTSPPGAVPVLGVPDDGLVTPVPFEDLPEALRDELAARVERLGYLGGFFSVAAHQPEPLLHFNRFTESLKAALPGRLSEVVALAAAAMGGQTARAELSHVVTRLGEATAVGVLLLLGRYMAHAMVGRVLGLGAARLP